MKKKFLIVDFNSSVQAYLDDGYEIEKMVALHVSTGSSTYQHGKVAIYLIKKDNK